ncbi:MAG TPA: hemolysin family protein [Candidatus Obscuribacterales bacterium]
MTAIALEMMLILVLIVANGVFSGSEIAIVSARKVRLEQFIKQGKGSARAALKLANSPNDFLSTVQIGITLIGILSGAIGGATLAQRLQTVLAGIPEIAPYSEGVSVVIVVIFVTYLSLVVGELVPKRIALNNPEQIACNVAKPMQGLARLTLPLVKLLGVSTELLLAVLGVQASTEPDITEEEIKVLLQQGTETGLFEEAEHEMMERVLRLGDRPIQALMTPRVDITWLNLEDSFDTTLQKVTAAGGYSRFPVGQGSLDQCQGIVRGSTLLANHLTGQTTDLKALAYPPIYVAENTRALKVLDQFKQTGVSMALIVDEYGGIEGLVTLTDLMEAIVGDLPSQENQEEPLAIQRSDGSWLLDGSLDVQNFADLLDQDLATPAEAHGFHTLGGFVMHQFGKVPQSGESFVWQGLQFEIMDMDGVRIDKVLVTRLTSTVRPTADEP